MSDTTWKVDGMTCNNCAMGLEKQLSKKGVKDVQVSFPMQEVQFTQSEISDDEIVKMIESAGYQVTRPADTPKEEGMHLSEKLFFFSLIFTVPLFLHMFFDHSAWINNFYVQLTLATPVFLVGAYYFGKSGLNSLKSGVPNMDVLIFTGATSAYFYSIIGYLISDNPMEAHNFLFFETTATIFTLVLLGNVIEHRSVRMTGSAIKELMALKDVIAKLITSSGIEKVPAQQLKIGDQVQLNNGDKVPSDGFLVKGDLTVDESMISGESAPVHKVQNEKLFGGTIIQDGNGVVQIEKVGNDTVISQIIQLVKQAQSEKPNIQKLGDKVSAIFVPSVLGISALTFILAYFAFDVSFRMSLMQSIAVMVISCPCAMGLATPTAVMAGLGRAAKKGILIKGGQTLEQFAKVNTFVFDKTGTLTTGEFEMVNFETNENESEVKSIIKSIEHHSSHPIAISITKALSAFDSVALENVKEIKGQGIEAVYQGNQYFLGRKDVQTDSHDINLWKNNDWIAGFNIQDEIKPGAKEMIQSLNKSGFDTILLSGDSHKKCEVVAKELGITEFYAEHKPDQKLEKLSNWQNTKSVAMVGDGINDAPALAIADISISFSNATEVAMQQSDIVLMEKSGLGQIVEAQLIAKHTLLTIKQNLFWAFFYNVVAIPVAAFGYLVPMVAALTMAFSDVIVIGNSIRLKKKRLT